MEQIELYQTEVNYLKTLPTDKLYGIAKTSYGLNPKEFSQEELIERCASIEVENYYH